MWIIDQTRQVLIGNFPPHMIVIKLCYQIPAFIWIIVLTLMVVPQRLPLFGTLLRLVSELIQLRIELN